MTDDSTRSVVHLAIGIRCPVVVTDVQASVNVVDIANDRVGGITIVVRVHSGAVNRTICAPETRDGVGIGGKAGHAYTARLRLRH